MRFDIEPKKKKKGTKTKLLLLFSVTFVFALFVIGTLISNYSPPVDVNIGNEEIADLSDDIDDYQEGEVDNRLKWIQYEDNTEDIPVAQNTINQEKETKEAVAIKTVSKSKPKPNVTQKYSNNNSKYIIDTNTVAEAPKPGIKEVKNASSANTATVKQITKVYIGYYSSYDSAKMIRDAVDASLPGLSPYVKQYNGQFIVQIGSFSDKVKAINVKNELSDKGYPARLLSE